MGTRYHELVIEGPRGWALGFIQGYLRSRGVEGLVLDADRLVSPVAVGLEILRDRTARDGFDLDGHRCRWLTRTHRAAHHGHSPVASPASLGVAGAAAGREGEKGEKKE